MYMPCGRAHHERLVLPWATPVGPAAGLGYHIACEVLGEELSLEEFVEWCAEARTAPTAPAGSTGGFENAALLDLAKMLCETNVAFDRGVLDTYILPDILTFLAQGSAKQPMWHANHQLVHDVLVLSCSTAPASQLLETTHLALDRLEEVMRR